MQARKLFFRRKLHLWHRFLKMNEQCLYVPMTSLVKKYIQLILRKWLEDWIKGERCQHYYYKQHSQLHFSCGVAISGYLSHTHTHTQRRIGIKSYRADKNRSTMKPRSTGSLPRPLSTWCNSNILTCLVYQFTLEDSSTKQGQKIY